MDNNCHIFHRQGANTRGHWQQQESYHHWQSLVQSLCGRARGSRMWRCRLEHWGGDRKGHSSETVHLLFNKQHLLCECTSWMREMRVIGILFMQQTNKTVDMPDWAWMNFWLQLYFVSNRLDRPIHGHMWGDDTQMMIYETASLITLNAWIFDTMFPAKCCVLWFQ